MALNLHADCKRRLIEVIAAGLPAIITSHGKYMNRVSQLFAFHRAEKVIPDRGPLREQLIQYVDDYPIIEFLSELIATDLDERCKYLPDVDSVKLIEIDGYKDPQSVAETFVEQIESLPWHYTLSLKMPDSVASNLGLLLEDLRLADRIRIVRATKKLAEQFPLKSGDERRQKRIFGSKGLLSIDRTPEWDEGSIYFQMEVYGFIDRYGTTSPATNAKFALRAFCGLAIALKLFRVRHTYAPYPPKTEFFVHRKNGEAWEIDGAFELESRHATTFHEIKFNGPNTDDDQERIVETFGQLLKVYSAGEVGARILLGSQWLFDSYAGHDEPLNFVQTMVVLEILLGDKAASDEMGLGALLRNRCAYLIGKSHQERNELLQQFNDIYEVRSQIVHRGKSRLTAKERGLFNKLREICRRIIEEEVKLLMAETETS